MSQDKAREIILERVENEMSMEIASYIMEEEEKAKTEVARKAKGLLVNAIQQYSNETVYETTVSVVALPNDEMKGRIIGREGRNIRTLETLTGVELIIDDTCKEYDKDYYKLNNFNQDNPNHSLTASEHMHKTWDYAFRQAEGDIILEVAAAHHDIGKYLTKTFVNRKGETTEVAHYYGHQNVGAYLLLQKCYNKYIVYLQTNIIYIENEGEV